uniref:BLTX505 n=1 Tax=Nephila pilipes TaxID=299642 RepID=A0A076L0A5_NEPPI|nr:BLTX505 [Nephila pilipes]
MNCISSIGFFRRSCWKICRFCYFFFTFSGCFFNYRGY